MRAVYSQYCQWWHTECIAVQENRLASLARPESNPADVPIGHMTVPRPLGSPQQLGHSVCGTLSHVNSMNHSMGSSESWSPYDSLSHQATQSLSHSLNHSMDRAASKHGMEPASPAVASGPNCPVHKGQHIQYLAEKACAQSQLKKRLCSHKRYEEIARS